MASRYSVIQFVPDPIKDETINIGVCAFGDAGVRVRFLTSWTRVARFADTDVQFLKDFAKEMALAASQDVRGDEPKLSPEQVEKMAQSWVNSIQLTKPRASLLPVDDLLNDVAARFLTHPARLRREFRNRNQAVSIAVTQIRLALGERMESADVEALVKRQYSLPGIRKRHVFDAVVANGAPYFAVSGVSFELPQGQELGLVIDSVAWSINDVKDYDEALPIGIIALPPRPQQDARIKELYRETKEIYEGLGAAVFGEKDIQPWVQDVVKLVPTEPGRASRAQESDA